MGTPRRYNGFIKGDSIPTAWNESNYIYNYQKPDSKQKQHGGNGREAHSLKCKLTSADTRRHNISQPKEDATMVPH